MSNSSSSQSKQCIEAFNSLIFGISFLIISERIVANKIIKDASCVFSFKIYFQIIPPTSMRPELNEIADEYVLQKCVEMTARKLSRGDSAYAINFHKESKLTLKEYKKLALSRNSNQSMDCHAAEAQFWDHLKKPSAQAANSMPIYAIDNDISRFRKEHKYWNLNELTGVWYETYFIWNSLRRQQHGFY